MKNSTSPGDNDAQSSTSSPSSTSSTSPVATVAVSVTVCVVVFIIMMTLGRIYLGRRSRRTVTTRLNIDSSENILHPETHEVDRSYGKAELTASDENIAQWQIAELPSHYTQLHMDSKYTKNTMEPVELAAYPYQLATKRNSVVRDHSQGLVQSDKKEMPTGNDAELFKWYWRWNKQLGVERSRHASVAGR